MIFVKALSRKWLKSSRTGKGVHYGLHDVSSYDWPSGHISHVLRYVNARGVGAFGNLVPSVQTR